jgi:hypothetical protein
MSSYLNEMERGKQIEGVEGIGSEREIGNNDLHSVTIIPL